MPSFDVTEKRPRINIFKLSGGYYFKNFFDDHGLFRELEPFYEKARYRFRMATAGERNKVMKLLDRKGYDPTLIEDPAPFTVEIRKYQIWKFCQPTGRVAIPFFLGSLFNHMVV